MTHKYFSPDPDKCLPSNSKMYDLSKLQKIAGNNIYFVEKMLGLFILETHKIIKLIMDNYNDRAFIEVKNLAHKLKSNLQVLGMYPLNKQISYFEHLTEEDYDSPECKATLQTFCLTMQVTLNTIKQIELSKNNISLPSVERG